MILDKVEKNKLLKHSLMIYGQVNDILVDAKGKVLDGYNRIELLNELVEETGECVYKPRIRKVEWTIDTETKLLAKQLIFRDLPLTIKGAKKALTKCAGQYLLSRFKADYLIDKMLSLSRLNPQYPIFHNSIDQIIKSLEYGINRIGYTPSSDFRLSILGIVHRFKMLDTSPSKILNDLLRRVKENPGLLNESDKSILKYILNLSIGDS